MRRKKRVIFLAFILMALLLAGCHNSVEQGSESQIIESEEIQSVEGQSTVEESTVEEKSEEENIYKDIISAYSDISTDIWYVIDDLNWNGRPEVIIAMRQGTALYTDFTVFELNESKDGIDQYSFSKENTYMKDIEDGESISDSLPDVIVDNVKWTRNSDTIQYEYIFTDTLRVLQGEHYVGYYRVWFDDSVVYQKLIAYMYTKQENETFTKEMYYDECGKEITKKEFEELISVAVEGKKLNWIKYEEEKFKDKLSEHGLLLESVSNNQIEVLTAEEFKYYIERYLDMTVQEISEETNVYLDEEAGTLRILSNAAFSPFLSLEDKGIFVICHSYDTSYVPKYVTVHYDLQHILLEELGITNKMNFEDIKEAMTMAGWQLDEHIEWGGDYADVYSNGELLYTFCSYREDGSLFTLYISDCPDKEEEPVKPMIGNWRVDEEGIEWCDIYAEVGNISEEERDFFTYFFQKNNGYGFLKCDYDNPKDVDLGMVFGGGLKTEWDETTLEDSELDYEYKNKEEVDETLLRFTGLTNADMSTPLYANVVDGKEVIAWLPFQRKPDTPVCLGGYKNGDTYTLLMQLPYSVVTLKKTDTGTLEIMSNRTLRSVTVSYEGKGYNSEKVYGKQSLSEYTLDDLEILRNEYYARHGMIFDDPVMTLYFESRGWYEPSITNIEFEESVFNEVEKANLELINEKMKEFVDE